VGAVGVKAMLDSGADQSVVRPNLVNRLDEAGWLTGRVLTNEVQLDGFQEGLREAISREVKLDLQFATAKLMLRNVVCWVAAEPLAKGLGYVLVSRPVMEKLGYDVGSLLEKARDNQAFRLELGQDPPVDMPPLKVNARPDATPVRCKARRYGPEQHAFMARHVDDLERAGLVFKNSRSRWCSPPLIV
jgi:hypothetical protein